MSKLWARALPLTRTERYLILISILQFGNFFTTFLFRADCAMAPRPAICGKAKTLLSIYEPTWTSVFGTFVGALVGLPVPLVMALIFAKQPVQEVLTDEEKRFQVRVWVCKNAIGWTFAIAFHSFCTYWLFLFATTYSETVFYAWARAMFDAHLGRLAYVPLIRGLIFTIVLQCSKCGSCCDVVISLFPHMIPAGKLEEKLDLGAEYGVEVTQSMQKNMEQCVERRSMVQPPTPVVPKFKRLTEFVISMGKMKQNEEATDEEEIPELKSDDGMC